MDIGESVIVNEIRNDGGRRKVRPDKAKIPRMDYYKGEHLAGVAFQLQDELRWYDVSS